MSSPDDRPPIQHLTWSVVGTFLVFEAVFTAMIIGAIVLLCVRSDGQAADSDAAAVVEIKKLLADQVAAWNRGDLDGFMVGYWRDESLTFFSGATVTRGWQATLHRYRQRYQAEGKEMGSLVFSEIDVATLGNHQALARGRWKLTLKDGSTPNGLFTLLLRRIDGQWRIVHDHTSSG